MTICQLGLIFIKFLHHISSGRAWCVVMIDGQILFLRSCLWVIGSIGMTSNRFAWMPRRNSSVGHIMASRLALNAHVFYFLQLVYLWSFVSEFLFCVHHRHLSPVGWCFLSRLLRVIKWVSNVRPPVRLYVRTSVCPQKVSSICMKFVV